VKIDAAFSQNFSVTFNVGKLSKYFQSLLKNIRSIFSHFLLFEKYLWYFQSLLTVEKIWKCYFVTFQWWKLLEIFSHFLLWKIFILTMYYPIFGFVGFFFFFNEREEESKRGKKHKLSFFWMCYFGCGVDVVVPCCYISVSVEES